MSANYILSVMDSTQYVERVTIGPQDPPDPFDGVQFIDRIISYHQEALKLGWIKEASLYDDLSARLQSAKTKLQLKDYSAVIDDYPRFLFM